MTGPPIGWKILYLLCFPLWPYWWWVNRKKEKEGK